MNRRTFTKSALATAGLGSLPGLSVHGGVGEAAKGEPFRMKFGPHAGHFRHHAGEDVLDQIRYAHEVGFRAWEDNRMLSREKSEQEAMARLLAKLDMEFGVFVAYGDFKNPTLSGNRLDINDRKRDKAAVREMLVRQMESVVELAKRVNSKWVTVVPGAYDPSVPMEYQTQNVVEHLKYMAEMCEPIGLVMVLEPLNYINHPGLFLQKTAHAHQVCKMVGSPSCKILNDLYHQQITEGNLITNMIDAWDEIAYIQVGDVPGRKEPTTGEINYKHIFQWLHDRGYDGIIGMEHGISVKGPEGEDALVKAYRSVDVS